MAATIEQIADTVERFACPACAAPAGSPCRTRSGDVAVGYHTTRFILVPALGGMAQVAVPANRRTRAGQTPARAPLPVRIGYLYAPDSEVDISHQSCELEAAAGCARTFLDAPALTAKVRPELNRAIELAREQRRCAENQTVVLTVYDLASLARTAAELIELCGSLRAADVQLELRTGPMAGLYDPSGAGSMLFTVLGAAGELDRRHHRRLIKAGVRAAGDRGRRSGRPKVFDEAMLSQARRLRDEGMPVPQIARTLTIAAGKNAGRHPSLASVYRALSEAEAEATAATDEGPGDAPSRGGRPQVAPSGTRPTKGLA